MNRPTRIAVLCSAHGFGHVTRQLAVGEELIRAGAELVLFTAAPAGLVHDFLPGVGLVPWKIDVGMVQRDSLTEDAEATVRLLEERCNEASVDKLASAIGGFDLAVVDAAPSALEACRRAGVPAVAVGNFDWVWLYRHYPALRVWAERLAAWQRPSTGLEIWPGPGLTEFANIEKFGLVGRRRPAVRVAERGVLVSFGGFGLDDIDKRLPRIRGVTYVLTPPIQPVEREDCVYVRDVAFPALVAGVDAVFTKPGYGIFAESALAGTPITWLDRGTFPEAPYLEAAMSARGDVKVDGSLEEALEDLWSRPRPAAADPGETRRLAERILNIGRD